MKHDGLYVQTQLVDCRSGEVIGMPGELYTGIPMIILENRIAEIGENLDGHWHYVYGVDSLQRVLNAFRRGD